MVYGSSDGWASDSNEVIDNEVWHFRGHSIVDVIFDATRDASIIGTPNLANASAVLLIGSSAGGNGRPAPQCGSSGQRPDEQRHPRRTRHW